MLDNQLSQLVVKQGHWVYLDAFFLLLKLPYPLLGSSDAVTPWPLELNYYVAHFSEVFFVFIQSGLAARAVLGQSCLVVVADGL